MLIHYFADLFQLNVLPMLKVSLIYPQSIQIGSLRKYGSSQTYSCPGLVLKTLQYMALAKSHSAVIKISLNFGIPSILSTTHLIKNLLLSSKQNRRGYNIVLYLLGENFSFCCLGGDQVSRCRKIPKTVITI